MQQPDRQRSADRRPALPGPAQWRETCSESVRYECPIIAGRRSLPLLMIDGPDDGDPFDPSLTRLFDKNYWTDEGEKHLPGSVGAFLAFFFYLCYLKLVRTVWLPYTGSSFPGITPEG